MDRLKKDIVDEKAWALVHSMRAEVQKTVEKSKEYFGEIKMLPTRAGMGKVFVYPAKPGQPVFFDIHGGGFVAGKAEEDAGFCSRLNRELGFWVINMEYRLAPEYLCPADKEDIYDMLCYLYGQEEEFPFDRKRMFIGGHSAGGNIAATVSRMLRDEGKFTFLAQVLDCPPLDFATPPQEKYFAPGAVEPEMADIFAVCYCRDEIDYKDSRISPYWQSEEELKGLPDALVISAENDSLRDEAENYARKLMRAGVEVTGKRFPHKRHAFACSDEEGQDYILLYLRKKLMEYEVKCGEV